MASLQYRTSHETAPVPSRFNEMVMNETPLWASRASHGTHDRNNDLQTPSLAPCLLVAPYSNRRARWAGQVGVLIAFWRMCV
jgi:hypothetical protein